MRPPHLPDELTVDAFHRGAFFLVQPARKGHRAGTDAMLVAAAVPTGFTGRVADLGAGAGAAGMAVAARCPAATVTLVERAPEMLACARQALTLEQNQALSGRIDIVEANVTAPPLEREERGLRRESFSFVVMNPPFNATRDRATGDPLKRMAHVMDETLLEDWIRTATAILKPRGVLAMIARPASLDAMLTAMRGRFGDIEVMAVHPRVDAGAIRVVVRARKGARGALSLLPPFVVHDAGSGFSARADAVNNGRASLFGD